MSYNLIACGTFFGVRSPKSQFTVSALHLSYLYFMPVFMLCSLEEGTLWTESCPRLRATIATALNLLRVPVLGLLAFWRFSRSSVLRLTPPRWSVHTSDTCILAFDQLSQLQMKRGWSKLPEDPLKSWRQVSLQDTTNCVKITAEERGGGRWGNIPTLKNRWSTESSQRKSRPEHTTITASVSAGVKTKVESLQTSDVPVQHNGFIKSTSSNNQVQKNDLLELIFLFDSSRSPLLLY